MDKVELYKKTFQKFHVSQFRDRSHISPSDDNAKLRYDGVHPIFEKIAVFTDEESFTKNLKNLLFEVTQETLTVVVEKNEEKVSLKIFRKLFHRRVGRNYFELKKNMSYVSVNMKTGNVYEGSLLNYQNKRKFQRKIRSNFFVNQPFSEFRSILKSKLTNFTTEESFQVVTDACNTLIYEIEKQNNLSSHSFNDKLFKFYLDKKNIKYPNNFPIYADVLTQNFRKLLKKLDNRIVDTYMTINNLTGKKLKKILHVVDNLNLGNYRTGLNLFGGDWLNQDDSLLKDIFNNQINFHLDDSTVSNFKLFASPKEIKKAFSIYKFFNSTNEIDGWTLRDHFFFYVQLKAYGDTEVQWESTDKNMKKFREEHLDWTDKLSFYKKGEYQRVYPKTFLDGFKNIHVNNVIYFPIVLTNTKEYNEESSTQSNCVRGYIGNPSSLIISLRRGSQDSDDRLTVEFRIHWLKNSQFIFLDRIQTRSKYNETPDSSWKEPLEILDKMVHQTKFDKYKLRKKCQNGVELESDTEFNENGYLEWTYKSIEKDNFFVNLF